MASGRIRASLAFRSLQALGGNPMSKIPARLASIVFMRASVKSLDP